MRLTLYSNHCPCCENLKTALDAAGILYEMETDTRKMLSLGITHLPMLQAGESMMNYPAALAWLKERTNGNAD